MIRLGTKPPLHPRRGGPAPRATQAVALVVAQRGPLPPLIFGPETKPTEPSTTTQPTQSDSLVLELGSVSSSRRFRLRETPPARRRWSSYWWWLVHRPPDASSRPHPAPRSLEVLRETVTPFLLASQRLLSCILHEHQHRKRRASVAATLPLAVRKGRRQAGKQAPLRCLSLYLKSSP